MEHFIIINSLIIGKRKLHIRWEFLMKKILISGLILVMMSSVFVGCGKNSDVSSGITAKEVAATLKNANLNGEWALVISAKASLSGVGISRDDILELDIAPKIKAKLLAKLTGQNAKKIYENLTK